MMKTTRRNETWFYTFITLMYLNSFFFGSTDAQVSSQPVVATDGTNYTFETIDVPGIEFLELTASSEFGDFAGNTRSADGEKIVGFTIIDGEFLRHDFPDSRNTYFYALSNSGIAAGYYQDSDDLHHGVVLENGVLRRYDFPGAVETEIFGISDTTGALTGNYIDASGVRRGFSRDEIIEFPGASETYADFVNATGGMVGSYVDADGLFHPYIRTRNGRFVSLDLSHAERLEFYFVHGINDAMVVVSRAKPVDGVTHTYVGTFRDGLQEFKVPGSVSTEGWNINQDGSIVGHYDSADGRRHGFKAKPATPDEAVLTVSMEDDVVELEEILVKADRAYSTGSSRSIREFDLNIRPINTAQDMLQLAPGLVIAQHAGGGKAEQIFLRGFDADHGTDVAISTDGIPVNMVSHGHGQGYADLHFAIPELVESIDVFKGPYFARYGNFSTAGSVLFRTKDHIDGNMVKIEGGEFNTQKVTGLFQLPSGGEPQNAYFGAQFYNTDGPVESDQDFQRSNLFGKFHTHLNETSTLSFSVSSFSSAWDASGQIPQRAVDSGVIGRFGSFDDLEGGQTGRQNINLIYTARGEDDTRFLIQPYFTRYNFKLFSNFTFFLDDPENGDMIEQTDDRAILGLNTEYQFSRSIRSMQSTTTIGGGFRSDDIAVALWHSPDRRRLTQRVHSDIVERNLYLWAQEELIVNPKLRLQLGLRGDYFTFNVEDHLDTLSDETVALPHASGYAQELMLNPKFNLVYTPRRATDVFVNAGTGFHSNDARDVVIGETISDLERTFGRKGLSDAQISDRLAQLKFDREQSGISTLPRAVGAEIGLRRQFWGLHNIGIAGWWLDLEEELVFVGDAGETEISGKSRRLGIDVEGRMKVFSWLWADADVNISRGVLVDEPSNANNIPLAPRITSTGGLTAIHPSGFGGSLRYRHIGDRPANEDASVTAEGYTIFNLGLSYTLGAFKYFITVENLFNADWNEAQFDTESRLATEDDPVSEIHFTPGNPMNVQVGVAYEF